MNASSGDDRGRRRAGPTGVGRPRDPNVDRSILDATRSLLVELGYPKTTITAIARRAGVGTSAIYRRWSTKESIIEEAVFSMEDGVRPPVTASLRADLQTWTRWFLERIAEPATRAAIPGLLSAYHNQEGAYDLLVSRFEQPARLALAARIAAAYPDRSSTDVAAAAEAAFDLLVAVTVLRGITSGLSGADDFCARTAESLALVIAKEHDPARQSIRPS